MGKIKISKRVDKYIEDIKEDSQAQDTEQVEQHAARLKKKKKRTKEDKDFNNIDAHCSTEDVLKVADRKTIKKSEKKTDANEYADSTVSVEEKRSKRRTNDPIIDLKDIDPVEQQTDIQSAKKKKNKDKSLNNTERQSSKKDKDIVSLSDRKAIKSKKKHDAKDTDLLVSVEPKTCNSKKGKNKKTLLKNDDEDEGTKIKKKTFLNEDEAEIKDEDIDMFCDEVEDEDNELYENWVQLVEAKLRSNTKEAKNKQCLSEST